MKSPEKEANRIAVDKLKLLRSVTIGTAAQPKPIRMWAIVSKYSGRYGWLFQTRNNAREWPLKNPKAWKIIRVTVTPDAPKKARKK